MQQWVEEDPNQTLANQLQDFENRGRWLDAAEAFTSIYHFPQDAVILANDSALLDSVGPILKLRGFPSTPTTARFFVMEAWGFNEVNPLLPADGLCITTIFYLLQSEASDNEKYRLSPDADSMIEGTTSLLTGPLMELVVQKQLELRDWANKIIGVNPLSTLSSKQRGAPTSIKSPLTRTGHGPEWIDFLTVATSEAEIDQYRQLMDRLGCDVSHAVITKGLDAVAKRVQLRRQRIGVSTAVTPGWREDAYRILWKKLKS